MPLYVCPRCDATVPRATASAGESGRCPRCYAPVGHLATASRSSGGFVFPMILVAGVLGTLVFGAVMIGTIYKSQPSPMKTSPQAMTMEEAELFAIKQAGPGGKDPFAKFQEVKAEVEKQKAAPEAVPDVKPAKPDPKPKKKELAPIPAAAGNVVMLSNLKASDGDLRQRHVKLRYRFIAAAPLLLLNQPTLVVRCGLSEKHFPLATAPGGDHTCSNAVPPNYAGLVQVYFAATIDKNPGLDRISNIALLTIE